MGAQLPEAEAGGAAATLAVAPTVAEPSARRGWTRNLDVIIPSALIGLLLFLCFVWPLFGTVPPPTGGNILDANLPSFSSGHPLGTDQVGNDLWSRLLYGGRNSLEIAFAVNVIGLVVGGLLGAFAAFWGSFTDTVIMRVLDVLIAFPSLVLALAIAQSLGPSKLHTIYALCFFSVPAFARLARAQTLRLRERPFMLAARLAGTRAPRILLRHITPNILPAARHLRAARRGRNDHPRGRAELPGPRHPAARAQLGEHDLRGAGRPLGRAQARAAAERLPLRHRAGLQPPRRRAARTGQRVVTRGEAPVDVRVEVGTVPASGPLLEVHDLRVDFRLGGGTIRAVDGLSYALPVGRTLAVIGESGSGKTVSSRAIMGLLPDSATVSGSVRFGGEELLGLSDKAMRRHRGADIAMVFQDPSRSLNPTMRIGAQIAEAVRAHARVDRAAARDRALELLRLVRLPSPEQRLHEYAHQLSGGMRQRVVIAIALASNPRLLIADEATTALDVTTQAQIMELLRDLQRQLGMALVMISHDLGLAASFADEVVVMYAGRAVEQAPTRELFAHVRMPYTKALLDAIPRIERPPHTPLPVVAGRPPDLAALPAGCPFAPRCPKAQDMCREAAPPLEEGSPGHRWACWYPCEDAGRERQRRRAAALRAQRRAGVRGARARRREGRRGPGRLGRLLRRARGRDAGRGRRDGLGQVDARALRAPGAAAEVGIGALPGHRPRRPQGPAAARRAPLAADGLPGPVRLA